MRGKSPRQGPVKKCVNEIRRRDFREGDDAKGEAFSVHSGKVEIRLLVAGEEQVVTVLGKGELLGGYAPVRKAPRSATAIAAEPVTLRDLDPAISLLRERYARSEITKEEFDAKLRALGGAG